MSFWPTSTSVWIGRTAACNTNGLTIARGKSDTLGTLRRHRRTTWGRPGAVCVATTVAWIAWLVTPPVAVTVSATMGVIGYVRARREGLLDSRCALGHTRRVIADLGLSLVAGIIGVVVLIGRLVS